MAMKRHLVAAEDGIKMQYYAVTAMDRGGMAFVATGAHLPEMDAATSIVSYPTTVSGRIAAGIMLNKVEVYDTTRIPKNEQNQDLVPAGSKVAVLVDGEVVTNMVAPARLSSIVPGKAYVTNSGLFTDSVPSTSGSVDVHHVKFLSGPSVDGYVKISVKMA